MTASSSLRLTATGCLAILLVQAVLAWYVIARGDGSQQQLMAVVFAATITGTGSLAGWLVARWSRGKSAGFAAAGGLAATGLRLLLPLLALAWLTAAKPPLEKAGAGGLLVVFYLSMLVLAIVLHILEGQRERSRGGSGEVI
jgi:hypothetical protein